MKLHLPKLLLTAVLACMVQAPGWADSVSVNFYSGDRTVGASSDGATLFGVNVSDWNDVTVQGAKTQTVTMTTADELAMDMVLTTTVDSNTTWGPPGANVNTLEQRLQSSYIDVNGTSQTWTLSWNTGDMWFSDVTFYMAGDGGDFSPISVNGVKYVGGVNNQGEAAWGNRSTNYGSYSTVEGYNGAAYIADSELNTQNAVRVTGVMAEAIVATNHATAGGRATLAGLQVIDSTDSVAYTSTLGESAVLADVDWSKQGVEGTTKLESIDTADRYLSVTADAAGASLSIGDAAPIAGLHLAANNLTVTGSTLTTGALHAKSGSILTMEAEIAGENLVLSGLGTIVLNSVNYTGNINVNSGATVQLLSNTKGWGSFTNSGTVHFNAGSDSVYLNNLIDQSQGSYKPAFVTNTVVGNLVINHTGNKTLSGGITIGNGGRVTLKGGTLGTANGRITHKISGANDTTLCLEDIQVYIGSSNDRLIAIDVEVGSGAILDISGGDVFAYDNTILTVKDGGVVNLGASRQSLNSNSKVILSNGTINGTGDSTHRLSLDFYNGGTIQTVADSTLNAHVGSHNNAGTLTMDVASGATLTMTGSFKKGGAVEKSNAGTLVYNGAAFTNKLTISSGVFEYVVTDDMSHNGLVDGGGTFRKSGEGTLTLSPGFFTTNLNVAQGKVVYQVGDGLYTRGISGAAGTVLEKTGKGTLKTDGSNFAGHILVSDGTFQLSAAMEQDNRTMTVANGATLDVHGNAAYYNLTLQEGATLTNSATSGNASDTGKKQFRWITLEGTATVSGNSEFGMVGGSYVTSYLDMQGNTLIKEGDNRFFLVNTTVSSAGTVQVDAGKVQALQNEYSGTLDISKLSVVVNEGGTFQLSGSSESIQDINLAGGALVVDGGHTLTAAGTTTMNGGSVTGNLCLSGAIILEGGGAVDLRAAVLSGVALSDFNLVPSEETPRTSGLQSLSYTLWGGEGSVTSTQSRIVIGGETYKMDATNGTFVVDGDLFYVAANDAVTVGGEGFTVDTDKATVFVVDGTLNVAGKPANAITINLQESSTLTTSADGDIGSITLAGNGLYDMGTNTNVRVSGLGDSAKWTGTVRLSGGLPGGASLSSYGNANSKIEMVGVSGWLNAGGMSTSSRLILTKETKGETVLNGFTVTAASNPTYSFLGGVQGEGDFTVNNGGAGSPTYTFGGDLSEWSGLFHVSKTNESNNGTVNLNLRNGGTLFTDAEAGVKLSATGGTLNVNIGSAAAETVMNGSITRTGSANLNLTVQSGSQLVTFNGGVNATTLNVQAGTTFNGGVDATTLNVHAGTTFNGGVGVTNMHVYADTVMNQGLTASDMLSVHSGKLTLAGSSDLRRLDLSGGSQYTGTLELAAGASLNVSANVWMKNSITLGEEASFSQGALKIVGTGNASTISVINAAGGDVFSMGSTNHVASNASVVMNSDSSTSLGLKLTNSSLTNEGTGTLTVNNAGNTITSLHAQGGDVVLSSNMGLQQAILGDNKSLTLDYVLSSKNAPGSGNAGNSDAEGSLELAISGGEGSKLYITLDGSDTAQNWQSNNTVRLQKLADQTKTVDEVHVSGALATSVFNNANTRTDLGGAKLVMADTSYLVVRKSGTYDLGASSIQLNGTTTFWSYGGVSEGTATITNSISGEKLVLGADKGTGQGHLVLNGALDLKELHVNSSRPTLSGTAEKKLQKLTVAQGNMLQIASGSSVQLVDSAKNTGVTFSAGTDKAATLKGTNGTGTLTQLQDATAYTIADMTLSNVTVSAATSGTAVNLTNVTAEAVQLAQGRFSMTNQAVVDFLGVEGSKACFTTELLSGITLNNADSSASLVVDLGNLATVAGLEDGKTYDLSITLSGFTMMNYKDGIGLVFSADSWLGQLLAEHGAIEYVSGSLETPAVLASNSTVKVTYTGIAGEGGANVGTIVTITGLGEVVPEPTTTTLSLLALCGLVARRRRK